MSEPNTTTPSAVGSGIPPFSPSTQHAALPAQAESTGNGVSVGKLLWLAAAIGGAYLVLKSIPGARRRRRRDQV